MKIFPLNAIGKQIQYSRELMCARKHVDPWGVRHGLVTQEASVGSFHCKNRVESQSRINALMNPSIQRGLLNISGQDPMAVPLRWFTQQSFILSELTSMRSIMSLEVTTLSVHLSTMRMGAVMQTSIPRRFRISMWRRRWRLTHVVHRSRVLQRKDVFRT